jgi:hypothetical protein
VRSCSAAHNALRLEVPEFAVVADTVEVWLDAVGVEQLGLMTLAEVPVEAQRCNGEISPSVTDRKVTEVDVPGPNACE